jgi:hypothetical protein
LKCSYIDENYDNLTHIFLFFQILIELGATDLLVPGILPIGCFPLYLTLYNSSKKSDYNARTGCLRRYNRLAFHHNRDLKQQLDALQKKYPKTKIMYGDYFKAAMQFVVSPKNFGEQFFRLEPVELLDRV